MRSILQLCLICAATVGFSLPVAAQTFPERGTAPVVDAANIIDDATEAALTEKLDAFEERSQRQFVIATIPDLEGNDIADYGYRLGREWELGDSENDDGIILLVAPNERKMRVEVGYGLEGIIPDGLAFEYVEGMKPYFREGDYSGGIAWGADQIIQQLELPPEEAARVAQETVEARESEGGFPVGALIWIAFIFLFFILPMLRGGGRRRRYGRGGRMGQAVGDIMLWEVGSAIARGAMSGGDDWGGGGGFGGGGGGGFGGFSGGGGSFGGGGASGGW